MLKVSKQNARRRNVSSEKFNRNSKVSELYSFSLFPLESERNHILLKMNSNGAYAKGPQSVWYSLCDWCWLAFRRDAHVWKDFTPSRTLKIIK